MLLKARWFLVRLGVIALAPLAMLTLGLSAYLLAPIYTRVYFSDWRFWRHHRRFLPLTMHCWKIFFKLLAEPRYRRMTALMAGTDWFSPPRSGPNPSIVQVRGDWPHPADSCGECSRCCETIDCPAHDPDTGLCASYGSAFWNYFPCGRYPASDAQIAYYQCPKWELRPLAPGESQAEPTGNGRQARGEQVIARQRSG